jgi:hypothetical protein
MRMLWALLVILSASIPSNGHGDGPKTLSFTGRISAYRPADRMQVVSFVANQEFLLFQKKNHGHEWLKLVYAHQGFSDLDGDVLAGNQDITIYVRRDSSCDQNLADFEKSGTSVLLEGSTTVTNRVLFASSVSRPPDSYRMKCYALTKWKPCCANKEAPNTK